MFISFRSSFTSLPLPALFLSFFLSFSLSFFISNLLPLNQKTWNGVSILLMLQQKKTANVFTQSNKIATFIVRHSQLEKGCNIL
jgi:hypothetical protein